MNHYSKKRNAQKREIIKRSTKKYISFAHSLDKTTELAIERIYKQNYGCCCIRCTNEYNNLGKAKKKRALDKYINDQIKGYKMGVVNNP